MMCRQHHSCTVWFTYARDFTSSCAITVMCECLNRDPCVQFVVSVVEIPV